MPARRPDRARCAPSVRAARQRLQPAAPAPAPAPPTPRPPTATTAGRPAVRPPARPAPEPARRPAARHWPARRQQLPRWPARRRPASGMVGSGMAGACMTDVSRSVRSVGAACTAVPAPAPGGGSPCTATGSTDFDTGSDTGCDTGRARHSLRCVDDRLENGRRLDDRLRRDRRLHDSRPAVHRCGLHSRLRTRRSVDLRLRDGGRDLLGSSASRTRPTTGRRRGHGFGGVLGACSFFLEQRSAHHLADRRARQAVAELDDLRHLVRGELGAAVLDQVGLGQARAGLGHDVRLDGLAAVAVGHADDDGVRDAGHRQQHLLDLGRVDVEPARDDELLLAVDDGEEPVGVHDDDVAGEHVAVVGEHARPTSSQPPVAGEDLRARDGELARLARRHLDGRVVLRRRRGTACPAAAGRSSPRGACRPAGCSASTARSRSSRTPRRASRRRSARTAPGSRPAGCIAPDTHSRIERRSCCAAFGLSAIAL